MTVGEVERAPPAATADCDASATEGGWKENGDSYEGPIGDVGSASYPYDVNRSLVTLSGRNVK